MLTGETIWAAWHAAGTQAGYRITLLPYGGRVREHLQAIRELVQDEAELQAALTMWWATPKVPARNLGMFAAQLGDTLARLPKPETAWCDHTPPCRTQQEHTLRWLDDAREQAGKPLRHPELREARP